MRFANAVIYFAVSGFMCGLASLPDMYLRNPPLARCVLIGCGIALFGVGIIATISASSSSTKN